MSYNMNQNMNNEMCMNNVSDMDTLTRLRKEHGFCTNDPDLAGIGCSFTNWNESNPYYWKVTMTGPTNSAYDGALFTISISFPKNYPVRGAEFKFLNKIYHLNVDFEKDLGHICLSTLNEWKNYGKVTSKPVFGVKQALLDIFCLFYNQGVDGAYSEVMANEYKYNRAEFDRKVKEWVEKYAKMEE